MQVVDYDRAVINDDRVKVEVTSSMEPHPISPYGSDTFGYQTIKTSARQVWGYTDVIVAPGQTTSGYVDVIFGVRPCVSEPMSSKNRR